MSEICQRLLQRAASRFLLATVASVFPHSVDAAFSTLTQNETPQPVADATPEAAAETTPIATPASNVAPEANAVLTPAQIAERWNAGEISDQEAFDLAQLAYSQQVASTDETFPIVEAIREPSEESRRLYREGRALRYGLNGRFVDRKRGLELLEQAAEAGSLNAMAEAALAYWSESDTMTQYQREAYDRATATARLGHPFAQLTLAQYFKAEGPNWNLDKSKEYYAKATTGLKRWAEAGDPMAASLLAGLYANGDGVEESAEEAERWHKRAAETGCAVATRNWGVFLRSSDRAQEAVATLRRAAAANDARAWVRLGLQYDKEENEAEKVACYKRAFKLGDVGGANLLALHYDDLGKYDEMIFWYGESAELECPWGLTMLGSCYALGEGVEEDVEKANTYFEQSA